MALLFLDIFDPQMDGDGNPLSGGKLEFFEPDGSAVQKDTYPTEEDEAAATNANPNPVFYGDDGYLPIPIILQESNYRIELRDSADTLLGVTDPYVPPYLTSDDFIAGTSYDINDTVRYDVDDNLYVSLKDGNIETPAIGENWSQTQDIRVWNSLETYDEGMPVIYIDGLIYTSLQGSNLNNIPPDSDTFWQTYQSFIRSDYVAFLSSQGGDTIVVTGVGFEPTYLAVYAVGEENTDDYVATCFGFANSSSDRSAAGSSIDETNTRLNTSGAHVVALEQGPGGDRFRIDLQSFDTDGFTLFIVNDTPAMDNAYLLWEAYR